MPEISDHSIEVDLQDGIATVTLSRPDVHDAMTPEASTRLAETFDEVAPHQIHPLPKRD